jgi:hypothetical protein
MDRSFPPVPKSEAGPWNQSSRINTLDSSNGQICENCGDTKFYHPINLCYNYEPKFNQVKKEIVKPNSWSNYFKSYFVEIKPESESIITYEPVYNQNSMGCSENCNPEPFDSGKAYCSPDLINNVGGIYPNFPFKNSPETGCTNTPPTIQKPIRTSNYLDKLEYIMNGMWIDIANYLLKDIYKNIKVFLTPITENDIVQVNIQMKNQIDEIERMKNEIKNMKTQMLCDLKHKIKNEFITLNNSDNNYKFLIKNDIEEINYKLKNTEISLEKFNKNDHKKKTKLLIFNIRHFDKKKLKSISNIKKLNIQDTDIIDCDYEKIEA